MADTAATLVANSAAENYPSISDRYLLVALTGVYGDQAGLTAQDALDSATTQEYPQLSDRQLDQCLLYVLQ